MIINDLYKPKHHIRILTATSLFDGHDASINVMRRIIQSTGAEVIHLGHNRSVQEIVDGAIQEDVQAVAITSYQGGHMEFFKYMYDNFQERGYGHIRIFGGGGGVILPEEIQELHKYGIARIYSPDDGRSLGLQGMINDLLQRSDFARGNQVKVKLNDLSHNHYDMVSQVISAIENYPEEVPELIAGIDALAEDADIPVLGITGTGGSGKSSLVDEIIRRYLVDFPDKKLGVICVDPTRRKTGGALLGDRIRMNAINHPRVFVRSMATRQSNLALSKYVKEAVNVLKAAQFDLVILETSGIGQSDTEIIEHSDLCMYVMTPEFGAPTQLEKIDMLEYADIIALNKFDKRGGLDALRDVKKQFQRNHRLFDRDADNVPVRISFCSRACSRSSAKTKTPPACLPAKGGPERTNKRFHYVSLNGCLQKALHGLRFGDPVWRTIPTAPDIYGKIGNSGVSICLPRRCQKALFRLQPGRFQNLGVDDHQRAGANRIGGLFMNAAIDQQCEFTSKIMALKKR
jgi:isobutyryl-CoA mutase